MELWTSGAWLAAALALVLALRRGEGLAQVGLAVGLLLVAIGVSLLQLSLHPAVVAWVVPATVLTFGLVSGAALWAARTRSVGQSRSADRPAEAESAGRRIRDSSIVLTLAGTGTMVLLFWLGGEGDLAGTLAESMARSAAAGFCAGGTVLGLLAWLRPDRPRGIDRDTHAAALMELMPPVALAGGMGVLAGVPAMQCYEWFEGMRPGMGYMAGLPTFSVYVLTAGAAGALWGRLRESDRNGRWSFLLLSMAAGLLCLATGTSVGLVPAGLAFGVALQADFGVRGRAASDAIGVDESDRA